MAMEPDGDRPQQPTRVVGATAGRTRRGIRAVMALPVAIVSTVAVTLGIAQPAEAAPQPPKRQAKPKAPASAGAAPATAAPTAVAPAEYVVADGDTVSGVAERFGLATAEVLACNGLGWSSLIFPGQRLACRCTRPNRRDSSAGSRRTRDRAARRRRRGHRERDRRRLRARRRERAERQRARSSSLIFPGESIVLPIAGDLPAARPGTPPSLRAPGPPSTGRASARTSPWAMRTSWRRRHADRDRRRHALSVADLDALNDLGGSTMIRPGQVLVVRRPVPVVAIASVSMPLTDESRGERRTIIEAGPVARRARPGNRRRSRPPRPRSPACGTCTTATSTRSAVPAATEPGLGHAGGGARPRSRDDRVLRRRSEPELRPHAGLLDITGGSR
jgi:LysM repeat protein